MFSQDFPYNFDTFMTAILRMEINSFVGKQNKKYHVVCEWPKILFSTVYKPRQTENYEFKMKSDVYGLKSRT